ncbi:conjugal transfer protein TraF [Colwellia echini]|uniref:Conjugal transfer protein TraF n=1 Tax=Colwellia echini TaxID=1982103 RepID=A0ABY3MVZ0_9GAMM|nr:conjugal transfer protein TraF [Colwellia echini]TYK65368.1 conjugal transfer protein TraF [Colwellia echini]
MSPAATPHPLKTSARAIKNALLLLPLMAISLPSYAESFTAKRAGQGFTGITQDFTSSLSNPALLTKFDDDDDVFLSLNLGAIGSEYKVIETLGDVVDDLDDLVDEINDLPYQNFQNDAQKQAYYDSLYEQVDVIVDDFNEIDEKIVRVSNGLNLQVIIPNKYLSLGLFTNQYGRYGGFVDYNQDDENVLDNAINNCIDSVNNANCNLNLDDLDSSTLAAGYSIAEVGFMAAYPVINHANYDLSIGAKLKYQRIDLYYNKAAVSDFDDDDYDLTTDDNLTDQSGTNVDLGMYTSWGDERQWTAALVLNNLMGQSVLLPEQNVSFDLDSSATLGLSYQNTWVSLATEIDLTDREGFENLQASKFAGIGAEFRLYEHFQFRLGYRADLNDVEENIYTAGIGISPWDVFAVDFAAFAGDNDTIGGALQLSLKL